MTTAVIVLAGGRGSRLGGAVKPMLRVDGQTLLARVADAVGVVLAGRGGFASAGAGALDAGARCDLAGSRADGAVPIIAVGDATSLAPVPAGVQVVSEEPRFGGPALALAAGLAAVPREIEWVTVLAGDLVHPRDVLEALAADSPAPDGVVLTADGRAQWLASRIRRSALERVLAGVAADESLHRRLSALDVEFREIETEHAADVDTLDDAARWQIEVPAPPAEGAAMSHDQHLPEGLAEWIAAAAPELGIDASEVPTELLLDVTADVAHRAVRPAAPITAFMIGLAVGTGRLESVELGAQRIEALADGWSS